MTSDALTFARSATIGCIEAVTRNAAVDWCGGDTATYVARTVASVTDPAALEDVRLERGQHMANSSPCDPADLARHVAAAYRAMWEAC